MLVPRPEPVADEKPGTKLDSDHTAELPFTNTMTLIIDNGAYGLKVGLAEDDEPRIIPNCITR